MFTFFEHTADLGIRIEASNVNQLFAEAAQALTAALIDDPTTIRPTIREQVVIPGEETDYLLFDWLRELLLRFETRRMLYCQFTVVVSGSGLTGALAGEPLDSSRHPLGHEVKAITYHGLTVQKEDESWIAEVIVDI